MTQTYKNTNQRSTRYKLDPTESHTRYITVTYLSQMNPAHKRFMGHCHFHAQHAAALRVHRKHELLILSVKD